MKWEIVRIKREKNKMIHEMDHEYTRNMVCPYCGNIIDSSDYISDGNMDGSEMCEECGKEFQFEADIDITWITSKI